ncbi:hypothetical protein [Rhodococcoides yunnanense]|jgi:hypothetical protein|uniref:hypothetical protein n=1 Tax=Rhodococcoides yunnanense TaxID=278209 RepID=UPI0022B1C495|nr:hypothetical protein [Rhodococcus yunnanensis]MCZ4276254.1 hypothetical protein [Rhodococcus yunnanensis]
MGVFDIQSGQPVDPIESDVHVQREFVATVGVVGSEDWAHIAVQSVFVENGSGFEFRVGQYRFFGPDATRLINELAHYGQISGDFKPVGGA